MLIWKKRIVFYNSDLQRPTEGSESNIQACCASDARNMCVGFADARESGVNLAHMPRKCYAQDLRIRYVVARVSCKVRSAQQGMLLFDPSVTLTLRIFG
jgi:hypothetical protein